MRILTVISGILLAATGVFTFAFYTNAFIGLAFVLGLVMLVAGLCSLGSYVVSGKAGRLPDTVFVEGTVTALYGFAVLNNEVSDAMVALFFGTWITISGVTRISQSFAVNRYRPRDWAKVMPLALAATIIGVIMMMPSLTKFINPMLLLGAAFIVNGLSQLVYAMYMRKHELTEREIEAQERAEARKAAREAERAERNMNRSISRQEREELREQQRRSEKRRQAQERAAKLQELAEKREARRPASEATVPFTHAETAQIRHLAQEAGDMVQEAVEAAVPMQVAAAAAVPVQAAEAAAVPVQVVSAPVESVPIAMETAAAVQEIVEASAPMQEATAAAASVPEAAETASAVQTAEDIPVAVSAAAQTPPPNVPTVLPALAQPPALYEPAAVDAPMQTEDNDPLEDLFEKAKAPVWNRPENIPSLRASLLEERAEREESAASAAETVVQPAEDLLLKRAAVNIEKIEEGIESVEFEPIVLPEPALEASGGEAQERHDIILALEEEVKKDDPFKPFEALKLEDLFGEDYVPLRERDPKEATRFTQSLNFDWTKM